MVSARICSTVALSLLTTLALVGCSDSSTGDTPPTSTLTITSTQPVAAAAPEAQDTAEPGNRVRDAYARVLDAPQQYSFTTGADYPLNGEYDYALADMTGDGIPELILRAGSADYLNPVRIFSATESGEITSSDDTLLSGAAGAGGYRVSVYAAPAGDRIYQAEWRSLSPEMAVKAFALDGDRILPTGEELEDNLTAPSGRMIPFTFHPLTDRAPLDTMEPTLAGMDVFGAAGGVRPGVSNNHAAPNLEAESENNTVTGTVQVMTAPELSRHQGFDRTPNGEDDTHRFALLVLNSPTSFSAQKSGSGSTEPIEQETTLVKLGELSPYQSDSTGFDLEGQQLTMSFSPDSCWFPSDASLPLGQPRCGNFTID